MAVDPKIIERVDKLMKLAAPSSGAADPERVVAALEAVRLFSVHDLVVSPREHKKRAARAKSAAPPSTTTGGAARSPIPAMWRKSIAARDSVCADPECQGLIERGDEVWMKIDGFRVEYLHVGEDCGW